VALARPGLPLWHLSDVERASGVGYLVGIGESSAGEGLEL
jgi:hypothetical protein